MAQLSPNKLKIQIRGPLFTSYSLAILNRNLALHLDKMGIYDVTVNCDNTNSDLTPEDKDLKKYGRLGEIFTNDTSNQDIVIMNVYPHDSFNQLNGRFNFGYIAWEDTYFPDATVRMMNEKMDALFVTTEYVKNIAKRSGVKIPIEVITSGIEKIQNLDTKYNFKTNKRFKFLHNSSAVPRKGVNILIETYFNEFSSADDCCLIIKTTPNIHNSYLPEKIENLKKIKGNNSPEILLMYDDVSSEEIKQMYNAVDALVLPTHAEGFGLPQAESMYAKKPVITTGFSGQMDFCNSENSYLVDFDLVQSESHTSERISYWAEPSRKDLALKMRSLYLQSNSEEVQRKIDVGFETVDYYLDWKTVARQFSEYFDFFLENEKRERKNLGILSTWNTKDGVARYAGELYEEVVPYLDSYHIISSIEIPLGGIHEENVSRIWTHMTELDLGSIENIVKKNNINCFHIQHHPGFFSILECKKLMDIYSDDEMQFLITLHSLEEFKKMNVSQSNIIELFKTLNRATIITHRDDETEYLKSLGLQNVITIPISNKFYPDEDKTSIRNRLGIKSEHIIASHGYLLPHKGFSKVVQSISELKKEIPDILYIILAPPHDNNSELSQSEKDVIEDLIKKYNLEDNVLLIQDFLSHEEITSLLHTSDMILLPYDEVPDSASGAIRVCLASMRPVVVTKSKIFDDVRDYVLTINDNKAETISNFIRKFYGSPTQVTLKLKEYFSKRNTQSIARKTLEVYK